MKVFSFSSNDKPPRYKIHALNPVNETSYTDRLIQFEEPPANSTQNSRDKHDPTVSRQTKNTGVIIRDNKVDVQIIYGHYKINIDIKLKIKLTKDQTPLLNPTCPTIPTRAFINTRKVPRLADRLHGEDLLKIHRRYDTKKPPKKLPKYHKQIYM